MEVLICSSWNTSFCCLLGGEKKNRVLHCNQSATIRDISLCIYLARSWKFKLMWGRGEDRTGKGLRENLIVDHPSHCRPAALPRSLPVTLQNTWQAQFQIFVHAPKALEPRSTHLILCPSHHNQMSCAAKPNHEKQWVFFTWSGFFLLRCLNLSFVSTTVK